MRFLYVLARWLGGRHFDIPSLHPTVLLKQVIIQKLFFINWKATWPVHFTSVITSADKIEPGDYAPGFMPGTYIDGRNGIYIGKNVWMGPRVSILSANHETDDFHSYTNDEPIRIGDNCWLGTNVVILPGVQLGKHVVVAAGAVVVESFPENDILIGGVPAKILKRLEPYKESSRA